MATATPPVYTETTPTITAARGLYKVEEAADYLQLSARHVRRLVAERRIAFHRLGRCVRFTQDDLTEYIEASRVMPITASGVWHDLREVS